MIIDLASELVFLGFDIRSMSLDPCLSVACTSTVANTTAVVGSTTEQLHVLDLVGYRLIRRIFECMEASVLNVFNRSLSLSQIKQIYHAE